MKDIFQVIFENDRVIVECDAERDAEGECEFFNFLLTDKENNKTMEVMELPDGLMALATSVANATVEDE